MSYLAGKRVCIAGAGIGGTAFALALEQACREHSISPMPCIQLFERDASATARANLGYSFSLRDHGDVGSGGLQVLRQLGRGLEEELLGLEEPGNGMHICWKEYKPLMQLREQKGEDGRPLKREVMRLSRSCLRQTLLSRVPPEWVQYSKVCTDVHPPAHEGGPVQLKFADGSMAECDLLVVADGASSKLRASLLPQETNRYAGVTMLFGRTGPLERLPAVLYQGQWLVMGERDVGSFMSSVDQNTVMWSLSFKSPEGRAAELSALFKDPTAAQEFLDREVPRLAKGFGEPLPSVIRCTPASSLVAMPAQDKLPHALTHNGIAFIGDAWHAMSPFSGSGANMALADAWCLAQQLVRGGHTSIQAAISEFGAKNAGRSAAAIRGSHRIIFMAHSQGLVKLLFVLFFKIMSAVMGMTDASKFWLQTSRVWPAWLSLTPRPAAKRA